MLLSGLGSNLKAMLTAQVPVALVISDRADAPGVGVARKAQVKTMVVERDTFKNRREFEKSLAHILEVHSPALVALAGFMRVLSGCFVKRFTGRLINIHPSLLPELPGLDTHRRALQKGLSEHGCTVHWVVEKVDAGPIIRQQKVAVHADDNAASLEKRVRMAEHGLYPRVINEILQGKISRS